MLKYSTTPCDQLYSGRISYRNPDDAARGVFEVALRKFFPPIGAAPRSDSCAFLFAEGAPNGCAGGVSRDAFVAWIAGKKYIRVQH